MPVKQVFVTALTDVWTDAAKGDPIGSLRCERDSNGVFVWYKCVQYNDATFSCVAGTFVGYNSGTGYTLHSVSADVSDTDNIGAGVALATVADASYCWIQISGHATLTTTLTAGVTDGFALTLVGANNGTLDVCSAVTDHHCAVCYDDANDEVILHCIF